MTSNQQYLSTSEAAAYCGSTKSTFDKLRLTGNGCRFVKIGRRVMYSVADLNEWMERNKRQSTSEIMEGDAA